MYLANFGSTCSSFDVGAVAEDPAAREEDEVDEEVDDGVGEELPRDKPAKKASISSVVMPSSVMRSRMDRSGSILFMFSYF